ncbi:hypothetical protein C0J52_20128 [Blattella germanica]|nr:hypothetical protein C0J52_20128 [Blattella germanica]
MMAKCSGITTFPVLSCLLTHHQRLTTSICISVIERNPGYDSLYRLLLARYLAEKYTTLQKTLSQITSTCLSMHLLRS